MSLRWNSVNGSLRSVIPPAVVRYGRICKFGGADCSVTQSRSERGSGACFRHDPQGLRPSPFEAADRPVEVLASGMGARALQRVLHPVGACRMRPPALKWSGGAYRGPVIAAGLGTLRRVRALEREHLDDLPKPHDTAGVPKGEGAARDYVQVGQVVPELEFHLQSL
jgi:hypothetical protein